MNMAKGRVIASANGRVGMAAAVEVLRRGGSALDAVEAGARVVESNVEDHTVGRAGMPNLLGQIELDASIMDGSTLEAGAVAALRNFEHPISIARKVMEELPHVLLADRGAARFAREMGFKPRNLMTVETKRRWLVGFDERAEGAGHRGKYLAALRPFAHQVPVPELAGTVNFIARDGQGRLATAVSTSGLAWKYPGRVGDSPIIGGGNYADSRYGAAACTGRGELAMRANTARSVVLYLKMGMGLEEAGREAMEDLRPFADGFGTFMNILSMDRDGNHAAFCGLEGLTYVVQDEEVPEYREIPRMVVDLEGV
jgi:beta-aspartyl-peptidase (threonine type)